MNFFLAMHPFFVHFPIALIITAFVFELINLITKKEIFSKFSLYLIIAGVIGFLFAYFSGPDLGERSTDAAFRSLCDTHEEASTLSLWLLVALAAVKLTGYKLKQYEQALKYVTIGVFICASFALVRSGYFGIKLVYEHGPELQKVMNAPELPEVKK